MQHPLRSALKVQSTGSRISRPRSYGVPPAPEQKAGPAPPQEDSALLEFWQFLKRNYGWPLGATILGIVIAVILTVSQTPIFRATATLEIQDLNENENFFNLKDVSSGAPDRTDAVQKDLQTQLRILQSKSLIGRVVDQLPRELTPNPSGIWALRELLQPRRSAPTRDDGVEKASRNFHVNEARQARIVDLIYDGPDPRYAAAFVNRLAQQYIDQNIEARLQISNVTSAWLARQLTDLRAQLEDSEQRLQKYTRTSGLVAIGDQRNPAEEKLKQVQADLAKAQENRISKQARFETAAKAPLDSLEVPLGSAMKDYQAKLTDLRRQKADLLTVFTPDYDGIKRLDAQISELEAASRAESNSIMQAIRNDYIDATRRESLLRGSYMQEAAQVSDQAGSLVEYEILKREVDSNRRLYETILQRTSEARVASALRASGARILDPARLPRQPYRPNWLLNLSWGTSAGILLGLVLATGRETLDRTVKRPGELTAFLSLPELGVVPKLRTLPMTAEQTTSALREGKRNSIAFAAWNQRGNEEGAPDSVCFQAVLTSIMFSDSSGRVPQIISVTSSVPQEGKTTLVTNLAAALAQMKLKVLLIDGDSLTQRLHANFGQSVGQSLIDLLSVEAPNQNEFVVQETTIPGVFLMALGAGHQSALDVLPNLPSLLSRARQEFNTILIDNVAVRDRPDARVLARMADGVVVVVRAGVTSRDAVLATMTRLKQDGSRLLGTVLNYWVP
jgi:polysaccharide biosynthesis transport protein